MRQGIDWATSVGSGLTFTPQFLTGNYLQYPLWPPNAPGVARVPRPFETVCVPLAVLFPSWRKNKEQYLPSQLVGGSTFEFEFAMPAEPFVIGTGDANEVLVDGTSAQMDFTQFKYFIRNLRVVLDERELCSSVNAMMWKQSVDVGMPIQPDSQFTQFTDIAIVESDESNLVIPNGTYIKIDKNISRVNAAIVTPLTRPRGYALDMFLPLVRTPNLHIEDNCAIGEYQFANGAGNWPLKLCAYGGEPTASLLAFVEWLRLGPGGMAYDEWSYYVNGFCMNFTRQHGNSQSGIPIKFERGLELYHGLSWRTFNEPPEPGGQSTMKQIREVYGSISYRWVIDFQRFINCRGVKLEVLE